jgi:CheY-like chemotaxis protein
LIGASEIFSVQRRDGGWVWTIFVDESSRHAVIVVRQSRVVYISYEAAPRDAQTAFEQMRNGIDSLVERLRSARGTVVADRNGDSNPFSAMQASTHHRSIHRLWTSRSFAAVRPPLAALIVDDDDALTAALEDVLRSEGLEPRIVHGGADALRVTQFWTPHVVVLDIQMPEFDGFRVAQALRTSPRLSLVPIIAHTSLAEREVVARGKACGMDAYCRKGDSPRVLLRLIRQVAPTDG